LCVHPDDCLPCQVFCPQADQTLPLASRFHDQLEPIQATIETLKAQIQNLREEAQLRSAFDYLNELVGSIIKSVESDKSLKDENKNKQIEQRLTKIRDAVLDLKVILVKLDDEDDAYIIFETLNTRGKDLSLADLVRKPRRKAPEGDKRFRGPAEDKVGEFARDYRGVVSRVRSGHLHPPLLAVTP
jgi:hypothetical protein